MSKPIMSKGLTALDTLDLGNSLQFTVYSLQFSLQFTVLV